jgi:hypothetical protein
MPQDWVTLGGQPNTQDWVTLGQQQPQQQQPYQPKPFWESFMEAPKEFANYLQDFGKKGSDLIRGGDLFGAFNQITSPIQDLWATPMNMVMRDLQGDPNKSQYEHMSQDVMGLSDKPAEARAGAVGQVKDIGLQALGVAGFPSSVGEAWQHRDYPRLAGQATSAALMAALGHYGAKGLKSLGHRAAAPSPVGDMTGYKQPTFDIPGIREREPSAQYLPGLEDRTFSEHRVPQPTGEPYLDFTEGPTQGQFGFEPGPVTTPSKQGILQQYGTGVGNLPEPPYIPPKPPPAGGEAPVTPEAPPVTSAVADTRPETITVEFMDEKTLKSYFAAGYVPLRGLRTTENLPVLVRKDLVAKYEPAVKDPSLLERLKSETSGEDAFTLHFIKWAMEKLGLPTPDLLKRLDPHDLDKLKFEYSRLRNTLRPGEQSQGVAPFRRPIPPDFPTDLGPASTGDPWTTPEEGPVVPPEMERPSSVTQFPRPEDRMRSTPSERRNDALEIQLARTPEELAGHIEFWRDRNAVFNELGDVNEAQHAIEMAMQAEMKLAQMTRINQPFPPVQELPPTEAPSRGRGIFHPGEGGGELVRGGPGTILPGRDRPVPPYMGQQELPTGPLGQQRYRRLPEDIETQLQDERFNTGEPPIESGPVQQPFDFSPRRRGILDNERGSVPNPWDNWVGEYIRRRFLRLMGREGTPEELRSLRATIGPIPGDETPPPKIPTPDEVIGMGPNESGLLFDNVVRAINYWNELYEHFGDVGDIEGSGIAWENRAQAERVLDRLEGRDSAGNLPTPPDPQTLGTLTDLTSAMDRMDAARPKGLGYIADHLLEALQQRGPAANRRIDELQAYYKRMINEEYDVNKAKKNFEEIDARMNGMVDSTGEMVRGNSEIEYAQIGEMWDAARDRYQELLAEQTEERIAASTPAVTESSLVKSDPMAKTLIEKIQNIGDVPSFTLSKMVKEAQALVLNSMIRDLTPPEIQRFHMLADMIQGDPGLPAIYRDRFQSDRYRLPDGRIVKVDPTATKGLDVIEFGTKEGMVKATRVPVEKPPVKRWDDILKRLVEEEQGATPLEDVIEAWKKIGKGVGGVVEKLRLKDTTARAWAEKVDALDKVDAADYKYFNITNIGAGAKLRPGETWRGHVIDIIKYFESRVRNLSEPIAVHVFRENLPAVKTYRETRFILPDGTKLTHNASYHADAADRLGFGLQEVLQQGIIRFAGGGAEIHHPITRAQAQVLADSIPFNMDRQMYVDIVSPRNTEFNWKVFREGTTADDIRNEINSNYDEIVNLNAGVPLPSWKQVKQATGIGMGGAPKPPKVKGQAKKAAETNYVREALAVPTNATTMLDMSAPGRQGLSQILTPEFWKAIPPMFGSLHYDTWKMIDADLRSKPIMKRPIDPITGKESASFAERIGTKIFSPASEPGPRAEMTASRWLEMGIGDNVGAKIWQHTAGYPIRAFNRAFLTFLNHLNVNRTEKLLNLARDMSLEALTTGEARQGMMPWKTKFTPAEALELNPYKNLVFAKEIAEFVNAATGHATAKGGLSLENAVSKIGPVLFSPGLLNSRIRMMNPVTYVMASPFVRKQYAKAALSTAAAWYVYTELIKNAAGPDAEVNDDITSSDFGKVRVGDARLDLGGGFLQFAVAYGRAYMGGSTSSSSGEFHRFGSGYQAQTQEDMMERFFVNKLNPVSKFAWDVANASEYNPFHVGDRTIQLFIPLFSQDVMEIYKENPDLLPMFGTAAFFGGGTQIYSKGESVSKFIEPENDWLVGGGGVKDIMPWNWTAPRGEERAFPWSEDR